MIPPQLAIIHIWRSARTLTDTWNDFTLLQLIQFDFDQKPSTFDGIMCTFQFDSQ